MISDNLLLNDDKTEFLIIGTRQQLAKVNINCIRVGSTDVCPVTVARNLQYSTQIVETGAICLEFSPDFLRSLLTSSLSLEFAPLLPHC